MAQIDTIAILADSTGVPITVSNPLPTTATISGDVNVDSTTTSVQTLIGKATNGDFVTAYASPTTITISGLPNYVSALTGEDIEMVRQINTSGAVVATYSRDDKTMGVSGGVLTVTGATFAASDKFVVVTNIKKLSDVISGVDAEFRSPYDFTAAYTSALSITLAGLPITITNNAQIVYIKKVSNAGVCTFYINGNNGVSITHSAGVLSITGAGTTPFAVSDVYEVGINAQKKAYSLADDLLKTQEQSPVHARYTDPIDLCGGTPYELTASFADIGAEIDCRGYNWLRLWVTVDIGTSTNPQIRILPKHTSAGAEEYREVYLGAPSSVTTINLNDYEVNTDADQLFCFVIPLNNTVPYVQVQGKDDANGDGQFDALYYTLGY